MQAPKYALAAAAAATAFRGYATISKNTMKAHGKTAGRAFSLGVILVSLFYCNVVQAQDIEANWRLVTRKPLNGPAQVSPDAQGVATWHNGLRTLIIYAHAPDGKPTFASVISSYKITPTEYTETPTLFIIDEGKGKPPVIMQPTETKSALITRVGSRITFKPPFDPVTFSFEADKFTATSVDGSFVDTWERVR